MDTVIPDDVVRHLRELAERKENPIQGGFTTQQVVDLLGVSKPRAREVIRTMVKDGHVHPRRVGLPIDLASELGYLGSCSIVVYYWRDHA